MSLGQVSRREQIRPDELPRHCHSRSEQMTGKAEAEACVRPRIRICTQPGASHP